VTGVRPVVPILLILATACGAGSDSGEEYEAIHPNEQDRLSAATDVPVVHVSFSPGTADLPPELAPLATFDESAAIGLPEALDGETSDPVFGTLIDAEVGEDGSIALLDADRSIVRILDPALEPFRVLGGEGAGPGGLSGARKVFWRGPDELAVYGSGRIDAFRIEDGASRSLGRTPIPSVDFQSDACALEDRLYVLGLRFEEDQGEDPGSADSAESPDPDVSGVHPELIHELGAAGQAVRSFSVPYRAAIPVPGHQRRLLSIIATGALECAPGYVWAGYSVLGEIHAHRDDGELAWVARIDDFDRPGFLFEWDASGRATGIDFEPGAFDAGHYEESLDRISLLSTDVLAVQVTRTERGTDQEGYPETQTYRTYLLDPRDGRLLGGFGGDHRILGGRNGIAILYREVPFPQIAVVRLQN